ncbi:MAG: gamma-glutamyl-gamma-aminobutyrate hydrolase family protein [Ignavibacteria bacterium]|nr:gamma-glutamyl-gamma-aminobutyrate hydrolase family protein [Ignavibacteria bacterium]
MIGLSKSERKIELYQQWLEYFGGRSELLDYRNSEEGYEKFEKCSGLVLTGGVDIYPEIYCDWDTPETKGSYIPERDGFELKLLEMAVSAGKPVLAICRGLQVLNVFFNGSLIFDIEEQRGVVHTSTNKDEPLFHDVVIYENTLLHELTGITKGNVNSYHHQAVDRLGDGLTVNCRSVDGIVEGIEYEDRSGKPFLLGIQWHPERSGFDAVLSANIVKPFISKCK